MAVTIVPTGPDLFTLIAQDLLFLADSPNDVQYVTRPQPGFQVSEELFERFEAFQNRDADVATEVEAEAVPTSAPKRGRPKKNVEAS